MSTSRKDVLNMVSKAEKAIQLRYKKAVLEELNLDSIRNELYDISSECDEVRYIAEGDEAALINVLDGDEEEAFEFRMAFSELSVECERLYALLTEEYIADCFDDFLTGISDGSGMKLIGWDSYEEDYYNLTAFEGHLGSEEAKKRLERLTKKELIKAGNQVFRVVISFLNVRYKYDYLSAAMDVLRNENTAFLEVIRKIEAEYSRVSEDCFSVEWKDFEKLISGLPERVWIE